MHVHTAVHKHVNIETEKELGHSPVVVKLSHMHSPEFIINTTNNQLRQKTIPFSKKLVIRILELQNQCTDLGK